MKEKRQTKIIELIRRYEIETQEELSAYLEAEGIHVTQATVSRDLRELKLTKISGSGGKMKYVVLGEDADRRTEKYIRVLKEGYESMDMAQNILVIKTVSGMASAVCAALDALEFQEVVGTIAGDDTIMCAIRTVDETMRLMKKIRKMLEE